ncbi:MAG: hypothetical protein CSB48_08985 [Proteobacteria bacterium]|nr:MAG: hypothetical protein CSB48_08985 [Pseudomonadota bacterium]
MVIRLFIALLLVNVLVSVTRVHASDIPGMSDPRIVYAGMVEDGVRKKDCARRLVSLVGSYYINRAIAVYHMNIQNRGELVQGKSMSGIVDDSERSGMESFLTGEYAVDIRRNGAVLHWKSQF